MTTKDNTLFRYHGRNWNYYNKPDFTPRFGRECHANDQACKDREEGIYEVPVIVSNLDMFGFVTLPHDLPLLHDAQYPSVTILMKYDKV